MTFLFGGTLVLEEGKGKKSLDITKSEISSEGKAILKTTTKTKTKKFYPQVLEKPKAKGRTIKAVIGKPKILEKNKVIEDPIRDIERNMKIQNIPLVKIPLRFGQKKISEQREKVNQLTTTEIKQLQTTTEINKIGRGFERLKVSFVDFFKITTGKTKTKKPKQKIKIPSFKKEKKIQPLTFKKPRKSIVEWVYIFGKKYKKRRWF